jgi:hypothetical protein
MFDETMTRLTACTKTSFEKKTHDYMSCTHESNRLAVDKPERHEPLPHKVPREICHARRGNDADDVRACGCDETSWRGVSSLSTSPDAKRTVFEVEGDHTAHQERDNLCYVADALEHGGLGRCGRLDNQYCSNPTTRRRTRKAHVLTAGGKSINQFERGGARGT